MLSASARSSAFLSSEKQLEEDVALLVEGFQLHAMKLSAEQLKAFDEQGYVFFPNCFSEEEIALLRSEAENILKLDRQEVWREKSGAPRTAFAAHKFNKVFEVMSRHPRLVEPLMQLFGESVYVPPVQAQRQGGFRRRRLAVASGLRHLGTRRRHAGTARDEYRDIPGRGAADQRRADDHSARATSRACSPPGMTRRPRHIPCGRWTRKQ